MELNEYQLMARYTANTERPENERMVNWALGAAGEAGEIADIVKKSEFHGHKLDEEELLKEVGDVMWYLANITFELDVRFEDVVDMNVEKLKKRYPEGFSKERSINR